MSDQNIYEDTVRQMIDKEYALFDRRSVFYGTVQGILVSSLVIFLNSSVNKIFIDMICGVGVIMSWVLFAPIINAQMAVLRLERWWEEHKPTEPVYDGPGVIGLRSSDWYGGRSTSELKVFHAFFIGAWFVVAVGISSFPNLHDKILSLDSATKQQPADASSISIPSRGHSVDPKPGS